MHRTRKSIKYAIEHLIFHHAGTILKQYFGLHYWICVYLLWYILIDQCYPYRLSYMKLHMHVMHAAQW